MADDRNQYRRAQASSQNGRGGGIRRNEPTGSAPMSDRQHNDPRRPAQPDMTRQTGQGRTAQTGRGGQINHTDRTGRTQNTGRGGASARNPAAPSGAQRNGAQAASGRNAPRLGQSRSGTQSGITGRGDRSAASRQVNYLPAAQVRTDRSRARNTAMAVRRPSELTVSKKELRLIKKRQKIEKFRATCARDEMIERKRNIGIIRVRHGVDRVMLTLILVLLCLGTVMVFSASYPSAIAKYGDSLHYIKRQAIFALMGIGIMALVSFLPYQLFRKFAVPAYVLAMILLVLVLLFGVKDGEAKRWLGIPNSSLSIQPSEVMKTALVLVLAWYMEKYRESIIDRAHTGRMLVRGVIIPASLVGAACVLILLEKHLSGTVIVGLIGISVMLIGGSHIGWTLGGMTVGGGAAVALFLMKNKYALERITTKLDENADALAEKWQTTQGLLAIGSGGLLGVGLGASRQKFSYVSEAQNDFIFTIWCEEMGFIGAVILIFLYIIFIWRGYKIAMHAPDTFSALTVFGIVTKVGIQTFLNIAVVCDIIPNTGVSLPFFSYGGSSLIILMAEMGIILSVSKHSYQKK